MSKEYHLESRAFDISNDFLDPEQFLFYFTKASYEKCLLIASDYKEILRINFFFRGTNYFTAISLLQFSHQFCLFVKQNFSAVNRFLK